MKPKKVSITYPFHKMDGDLQWALIEALAEEIRIHEPEEGNPEDCAISRLADDVFVLSNAGDEA